MKLILVSAVALIDLDGRILLAQRPKGKPMAGLWEFPGGKIEKGEAPEIALVRELKEEIGIDTQKSCLAPLSFNSHQYDSFQVLILLFACRRWKGIVVPQENQELKWVKPHQLKDYPMPPADEPLVPFIRDWL